MCGRVCLRLGNGRMGLEAISAKVDDMMSTESSESESESSVSSDSERVLELEPEYEEAADLSPSRISASESVEYERLAPLRCSKTPRPRFWHHSKTSGSVQHDLAMN